MNGRLLDAYREGNDAEHEELGPHVVSSLEPTAFLDFEYVNGNHVSFAAHRLASVSFDPSEGIVLDFSSHEVLVRGRYLRPLYRAILEQRVARIVEGGNGSEESGVRAEVDLPYVQTLTVSKCD